MHNEPAATPPVTVFRSVAFLCFWYVATFYLTTGVWGEGLRLGSLTIVLAVILLSRMLEQRWRWIQYGVAALISLGILLWLPVGRVTLVLAIGWLLWLIPKSQLDSKETLRLANAFGRGAQMLTGLLLLATLFAFWESVTDVGNDEWLMDIGWNTQIAAEHFLNGLNPYQEYAQTWQTVQPQEHVSGSGRTLKLFGFSYTYGYPYFPVMFLGYTPFVWMIDGLHSIRVANLFWVALTMLMLLLIERKIQSRSSIAYVWIGWMIIPFLTKEVFIDGVNDIFPATLMMIGFYQYVKGGRFSSGFCFGLSQSSKLLPGALGFLPLLLFCVHTDRRSVRSLLGGFVIACAFGVGPYLLADPEHFLSSTILFYIVQHGMGDSTSIFFFLPESLKPVWHFGGMMVTVVVCCWLSWRAKDIRTVMGIVGVTYLLFISVSRMNHLNYVVAALPFGLLLFSPAYRNLALQREEQISG